MVVESESGAVQWELQLNSRAGSPGPATLPTADHRSAFLMWGDYQELGNETVSDAAQVLRSALLQALCQNWEELPLCHSVGIPIYLCHWHCSLMHWVWDQCL